MTIDDTVARVRDRMTHVPGLAALILIGSTARGDRQKNSDIDIVALIYDNALWPVPFRDGGRETFVDADGVQVELAFTTLGRLRQRMIDEAAEGRRARCDWVEDAALLLGGGGEFEQLRAEGRQLLAQGPPPLSDSDIAWSCYEIWNLVKDVEDCLAEPACAAQLARAPYDAMLRFCFRLHQAWEPRAKAVLQALETVDPALYELASRFLVANAADHYAALLAMQRHLAESFNLDFHAPYISPARSLAPHAPAR